MAGALQRPRAKSCAGAPARARAPGASGACAALIRLPRRPPDPSAPAPAVTARSRAALPGRGAEQDPAGADRWRSKARGQWVTPSAVSVAGRPDGGRLAWGRCRSGFVVPGAARALASCTKARSGGPGATNQAGDRAGCRGSGQLEHGGRGEGLVVRQVSAGTVLISLGWSTANQSWCQIHLPGGGRSGADGNDRGEELKSAHRSG